MLIDFPDEPGTISRDEVEQFCNQPGYSGFGNNGSVRDYFHDNSIGRCRYTNIVVEYYRAQHPKSHYTDPNIPQGTRARQLIVEALTHLKNNGFDFTQLTADGGGFVYAMNVYYAGHVVNNWAEGLWPHAWHLATPIQLAPGKSAFDYQFTDMADELTLGTFCHENGHMLCDYPDLYDYGSESSGAGAYCLMCAGGNISEKNPTHISAYLKRLSGWSQSVTPIQHNQQIALRAGENEFAIHAKHSGEYFIIENRTRTGRDGALPDEGLAIWQVDEDGNNSNEHMTPGQHYELSLEQADADFRLETTPHHYGDSTDLYGQSNNRFADSTTPGSKWWDGTKSNLDIFDISAPGGTMSFQTRLSGETVDSHTVHGDSTPHLSIPDSRSDRIVDTISIGQEATIAGISVTLDLFGSHMQPWLKRKAPGFHIREMAIYNLTDKLEQDDEVTKAYNKSLLYLVSKAFEEKLPARILGMQKHSKVIERRKIGNLTIHYSEGDVSGARVTASETHGGFDNDPLTMNHVLRRVLGKKPVKPFTKESLKY